MALQNITRFEHCISDEEKRQLGVVTLVNLIVWLGILAWVVATVGIVAVVMGAAWFLGYLLSEYHVRSIEVLGASVSDQQLPEVHTAAQQVCQRFGVKTMPRIVVLNGGEVNAFAVKFAKKRVIVIYSELLEGIINNPAQLRFLLAHEMCHGGLDHGVRGVFEIWRPAAYRQARELTCDNAGLVAAMSLPDAQNALKMLAVGPKLHTRLTDQALMMDARRINSGFEGWLLRQYLTHPPAGTRIQNLYRFHTSHFPPGGTPAYGAPSVYLGQPPVAGVRPPLPGPQAPGQYGGGVQPQQPGAQYPQQPGAPYPQRPQQPWPGQR